MEHSKNIDTRPMHPRPKLEEWFVRVDQLLGQEVEVIPIPPEPKES